MMGSGAGGKLGNGSDINADLIPIDLVKPGMHRIYSIGHRDLTDELPTKKAAQIALGGSFSMVVTEEGELYAFGTNDKGQLGLQASKKPVCVPTKVNFFANTKVLKVACGEAHAAVLTREGKLYLYFIV
jgi:alpha-tubulin suppressor-like RCC1 family protein